MTPLLFAELHGARPDPLVFRLSKALKFCAEIEAWRKRWARHWDEVKFCSEACRRSRGPAVKP